MNLDTIWRESFNEAIADIETRTGTNPMDWRVGGRATKVNPDKENHAWWDVNGREMFANFIELWRNLGWKIWQAPDGNHGVEIGFNVMFGDVLIKGFADLIAVLPTGELAVIDFKTGSSTPDTGMQLGLYACCIESTFGIRPTRGFFYSAREAQFIEEHDIDRWTIPLMTELFRQFDLGIKNRIFLPNVGMSCRTCGVKDYCHVMGGQLAPVYDSLSNLTQTTQGEKNER